MNVTNVYLKVLPAIFFWKELIAIYRLRQQHECKVLHKTVLIS